MASRTRSTSIVNSLPGMGSNLGGGPTRTRVELLHVAILIASKADAVDAPVADSAFFVGAFSP